LFLDEDDSRAATSTDPERLAAITSLTYQRLGVLDTADEVLRDAARAAWVDRLVRDGAVADEAAARVRLEAMREGNPANHRRELARHVRRERRRLIDDGGVLPLLHPNARALIDRIASHGVGTIVVDECHHLLDHWALVVRALLERLDDVQVVGLTATLPDPGDRRSYDNYTGLLGPVTFEVPTPAVVKEGDLAPWRNLVYFTEPTGEERRVLRDAQAAFRAVTEKLLGDRRLERFAITLIAGEGTDPDPDVLAGLLADRPLLAVAAGRALHAAGTWPRGVPQPAEAFDPLTFDDELLLFERFGLDVLALSPDAADQDLLVELRGALAAFGMSLTERGLRQGRSVGDLILSFSASKDAATIDILQRELRDLGPSLRAVVVTDFARASSAVARVDSPLQPDAGSAFRVFHALIDDATTERLDPMLVTGSTILVDADHGDELVEALNAQLEEDGLTASCSYRPTDDPRVLEIAGTGRDWSSGTYVRLLTEVFESGATQCLVGTRGLFGEGWDALSLNTLIDLTSVTTSTGVQQLRGRSIRVDPHWPRKVAHDWDVICVDTKNEQGDLDLRRLARRHRQLWGIVPDDRAAAISTASGPRVPGTARPGTVVKGLGHVSSRLVSDLYFRGWRHLRYGRYTGASLEAVGRRDGSYELWGIGEPYDNFDLTASRFAIGDLRIRTVLTIRDTLAAVLRRLAVAVGVAAGAFAVGVFQGSEAGLLVGLVVGLVLFATSLLRDRHVVIDVVRLLTVGQPPDRIVRDVALATFEALRAAGEISTAVQPEQIRVAWTADEELDVVLDHVDPDDGRVFAQALGEVLGPVGDPRYLIRRTDGRLPHPAWSVVWLPIRAFTFPRWGKESLHPVPSVLGTNREAAERFAAAWSRSVGGGELIYTRSDDGRRLLLDAQAQRHTSARGFAYSVWR
jgi:hypothetical protein